MTTARYRSYRRALAFIDLLEDNGACSDAAEILRQGAEDLLLSREPAPPYEDPMETAARVLTELLVNGDSSRALVGAIMESLQQSGPERAATAARPLTFSP